HLTTPELYTLSLHDALPIYTPGSRRRTNKESDESSSGGLRISRCIHAEADILERVATILEADAPVARHSVGAPRASRSQVTKLRSEEHTSELQSRENLVCRL